MSTQIDIIAPQAVRNEPEPFQSTLICNITAELLKEAPVPCLLRAPTGSGKTFVIARVLEQVSEKDPTIWFWFVPFVNLVQQTEDVLSASATGLSPISLLRGRNQEPAGGMVIISTAAAIARATSRTKGYADGEDDTTRSLAAQVELARARGLRIGLVVDEAHIALDSQTEFGKFVQWLSPCRMVMATATPRDQRLTDFIVSAGYSAYESFTASRDEVVNARLNKRYIKAVIYSLRGIMKGITDLEQTVLRQAWRRSQRIKAHLQSLGVPVVPLLLIQVGNGATAVADARQQLMELCGVHPECIGEHSSDDPDPVLMASIANDSTKEVLIFKQSAGTGFDAPRSFVLASLKSVNDPDFAAQFIGRVMRVHREIRSHFPRAAPIDVDLDTAYVYLANAEAQKGFQQAVNATTGLKSQLEGQTEKLVARRMASGAVVYTNQPAQERPLIHAAAMPESVKPLMATPQPTYRIGSTGALPGMGEESFAELDGDEVLDEFESDFSQHTFEHEGATSAQGNDGQPAAGQRQRTRATLTEDLASLGLAMYPLRKDLGPIPDALQSESRPEMGQMAAIATKAATSLKIAPHIQAMAVSTALGRSQEKEVRTELTQKTEDSEDVFVVVSRTVLQKQAREVLTSLPQVEDEDIDIIVNVLTQRMLGPVRVALADPEKEMPPDAQIKKWARDAAFLVIRREREALAEMLYEEIAAHASTSAAASLPDAMMFAADIVLASSKKNIYGVLPPSKDDVAMLQEVLYMEARSQLKEQKHELDDGRLRLMPYDNGHAMGIDERDFAEALDRSDAVHWWHRNPDRKDYSVRMVRGEHKNYFYPDFLICLEHYTGDEPMQRLVETKESVKDAVRKARRASPLYGRVLFMTKDQSKWKWINEDGSLGSEIDLDDLSAMQDWLRETVPLRG